MWKDEIVEEIYSIRQEYAKSFNYDLNAIFTDLRKKEELSGRKIVSLSRKPGIKTRWSGKLDNIREDAKEISWDTSHE
ncbi:MAG: hypothetical protein F6K62_01865 [Sphaerospermopsis sp. SIO1G2]|nr:hypothetical protein [Sphaerospermopsis sp. SIO1G2]